MCHKQENLQNWLTDEKARDQFVIRAGSDTEVFWNDARHLKPDPVYKRAVSAFFSFDNLTSFFFFFSWLRKCTDYMNDFTCLSIQYWTESYVQWSPLGTYLATVHRQGAAVWGGASTFNRLMRYAHPQVFFHVSFL